jgi:hypothetical protein
MQTKSYFRIFNKLTKKYVTMDDGSFLVMEYPKQAENFIERRLKGSRIYQIIEWRKNVPKICD